MVTTHLLMVQAGINGFFLGYCSVNRCLVYTATLIVVFPQRGYRIKPTNNQEKQEPGQEQEQTDPIGIFPQVRLVWAKDILRFRM